MSVRTIVEHGCPLTVQTLERVDALGATYWQARAMFRTASGARLKVVNQGMRHGPPDVLARLGAGEAVPRDSYFFATTIRFETSDADLDHFSLLSGGRDNMASPDGGRGASQWTQSPLSHANAHTTATTPTPHWPLLHTDQNQNG